MNSDIIFSMGTHTYVAKIRPAEESGYIAYFPSLPGCHTQGRDINDVIDRAKEVLAGYLSMLKDEGLPIPKEKLLQKQKRKTPMYISMSVAVS